MVGMSGVASAVVLSVAGLRGWPDSATVTVELGGAPQPFPHTWKRIFGAGHAALGLRNDFQSQLALARDQLGLQGVRQHGLFDDDMGPVVVAHRRYNFTLIDRLWTSYVDAGLHPVVELSFMPSFLGNCSWQIAPGDCHANEGLPCNTTRPGRPRCPQSMAYGGVSAVPTDFDDWRHLVQSAVQMAVDKFGLPEVQLWRFEVWNELWGMSGGGGPSCTSEPCVQGTYMKLYNASAVGVRQVHPSLRVGGPATEHLNTQNFLAQAKAMGAPVDFVSTHNYPTGPRSDGSGCPQGVEWAPDCFVHDVLRARAAIPAEVPFLITEYSVQVGEGMALASGLGGQGEPPFQHDGPGAAAFVFRVVPQLASKLDALSYWTFSDIFEENSIPTTEFHPVGVPFHQPHYGAMTLHGVPKPVWRAFELLHTHAGTHQVPVTTTIGDGDSTSPAVIAAAATVNLTAAGGVAPGSTRLFVSHWDASGNASVHPSVAVAVTVRGVRSIADTATVWQIDDGCAANLVWAKMGSPPVPTAVQLDTLVKASQLIPHTVPVSHGGSAAAGTATLDLKLPPNSAAVIELH